MTPSPDKPALRAVGCAVRTSGQCWTSVNRNREREKWPGHSRDCPPSPMLSHSILDFPLVPVYLCHIAKVHRPHYSLISGYKVNWMTFGSHGVTQAGTLCKALQPCQLSSPIASLASLPAGFFWLLWVNFYGPTGLPGPRCTCEVLHC